MKSLVLIFAILAGRLNAVCSVADYQTNFGGETAGTAITNLSLSANQYWVNNGAGGSQIAPATGWSTNSMNLSCTSFAFNGNTKTSYTDLTASVRVGTSARAMLIIRTAGGQTAGNPTSGYAAMIIVPSSWYIFECTAAGYALNVTSGAVTIANTNDFTIRMDMVGTTTHLYVNNVYLGQYTDSTFTSGGVGLGGYTAPCFFDNLRISHDANCNSLRNPYLRNILRLKLGLLNLLFGPSDLEAITQSQIQENLNIKWAAVVVKEKTPGKTPQKTPTPDKVTATPTATTTPSK